MSAARSKESSMPKRICAALMLALAVLATAGCAGTDRFQARADVVRAHG